MILPRSGGPDGGRKGRRQGDAAGLDKQHQVKWSIYCPAIANDTLLCMITALVSYSIRSYGGHLGVDASGRHAPDAHTTSEFMSMYSAETVAEVSWLERNVNKAEQWSEFIGREWESSKESFDASLPF